MVYSGVRCAAAEAVEGKLGIFRLFASNEQQRRCAGIKPMICLKIENPEYAGSAPT